MSDENEFKFLNTKILAGEASDKERTRWEKLKGQLLAAQMDDEKRKYRRADIPISVSFQSNDELLKAVCSSLGAGGIGVELAGDFQVDEEHRLELNLPSGDATVLIKARVAWTGGGHVGFEFLNLPNEIQDSIDALVWEEVDVSDL